MIDFSPAKRTGTAQDIARAAEFLLSEDASIIIGIDLLIDCINKGRILSVNLH